MKEYFLITRVIKNNKDNNLADGKHLNKDRSEETLLINEMFQTPLIRNSL